MTKQIASWPAEKEVANCDPVAVASYMIAIGADNADFPGDGRDRSAADEAFWRRVKKEARRIADWAVQGLAITGRAALTPALAPNDEGLAGELKKIESYTFGLTGSRRPREITAAFDRLFDALRAARETNDEG